VGAQVGDCERELYGLNVLKYVPSSLLKIMQISRFH